MTFTEAAAEVLRLVGKPLHYKDITEIAIQKNLLSHVGKSPEETMGARLASQLKKEPKDNPLVRLKPGIFALRSWEESGPPGFAPDNDLLPPYGPGPKKEPPRAQPPKSHERRENKHDRGPRKPRPDAPPAEQQDAPAPQELQATAQEPSETPAAAAESAEAKSHKAAEAPEAAASGSTEAPEQTEESAEAQDAEPAPEAEQAEETSGEVLIEAHAETKPEAEESLPSSEDPVEFEEASPEEVLAEEEALAIAEEEVFHVSSPPPTLLLAEEELPTGDPGVLILSAGPSEFSEEEVTTQLPLKPAAASPEAAAPAPEKAPAPQQERRRHEDRQRRRDRHREEAPPAAPTAPAPDEMLRADLVAGAMEIFGEEEDDDQPILGGDSAAEQRTGRRRRRRRNRGNEGGRPEMEGLPSYTVSPAFGDAAPEPREEPPPAKPTAEGEGEELAGRDMVDLLLNTLGGFERSGGPVPLRNLAESLQRRGRLAGELPQIVAMLQAAARADNARRSAEGKRARFRLGGGRVALTDWSMSQDLLRLEGEALAAIERYRDASRKAFARRLGELPGHAFVELCLSVLERLGVSQFKMVKRQGAGGEVHFNGVLRGPGGETRLAILVRKDAREIGRERVIEARGSLHNYSPATALWLLTSGQVLSGAREEAQAPGAAPVALFDGMGLARLCDEHGLGVVRTTLPIALPDLDFFEALRSS